MMMEQVLEIQKGGEQDILLMHANAYTPGCYRQLCTAIIGNYNITAPYQRQLWKDSNPDNFHSWKDLASDINLYLASHLSKPVIGIGHSMGAIALWHAAKLQPQYFEKLILIEPVILPPKAILFTRFVPYSIKPHLLPIIKIALNRKDSWSSQEALLTYLHSKKVFQRFEPEVLHDFVQDGFVEEEGLVRLRYPKQWEARIYGTAPYMWHMMSDLPCPMTVMRAQYSDVMSEKSWVKIKKSMPDANHIDLDGMGHLAPFEKPREVGQMISSMLG